MAADVTRRRAIEAIERGSQAPGVASVVGRYRADDFGVTLFDELRAGRTLTVGDVATDHRLTPGERASYPALGIGAFAAVPLVKGGRHVAALVLHEVTDRQWSGDDVALIAVILDLDQVEFFDSSGLRMLRRLSNDVERAGGQLTVVTAPDSIVSRLLALTNMDTRIRGQGSLSYLPIEHDEQHDEKRGR